MSTHSIQTCVFTISIYSVFICLPLTLFNQLPDDKILDCSKLKEFADDNFKFDENGSKSSKQIENTVGKGEIALFPSVFKRLVSQGHQKVSLCGMG